MVIIANNTGMGKIARTRNFVYGLAFIQWLDDTPYGRGRCGLYDGLSERIQRAIRSGEEEYKFLSEKMVDNFLVMSPYNDIDIPEHCFVKG